MSGPYDKPDDPEDVTLWAGRLRPWPASTAPATADDGDDLDVNEDTTLIARRGTARRAEVANGEAVADDTVIVPRDRAGGAEPDDTVIVSRESQDDTVLVRRGVTTKRPGADEVEDTAPADPARRAGTVPALQAAEEDTAPTTTSRRASSLAEPLPATAPGRRRASGAHPDLGAGTDVRPEEEPPARIARVPGTEAPETYGPRGDDAVRVHRTVPASRVHPGRDASLVRSKTPRRGVVGPLVIGGTTVIVLAGALAAFVLLAR